jgi:hypothetical protein
MRAEIVIPRKGATSVSESTRHRWNAIDVRRVPACDCADGNDRTERTCAICGMVKVTVHPPHGDAWREWRTKAGAVWQGTSTPPCVHAAEPVEVVFS